MSFIDTLLASTGTESSTPLMSLITWLLAVEAALILYLSLPFQIKFRRTFAEVLVASPVLKTVRTVFVTIFAFLTFILVDTLRRLQRLSAKRPIDLYTAENLYSQKAKLQRDFFIVSFTGLLAIVTHQVLLMLLRMGRYRKERNVLREQVKELGAVPRSVEGLEGVRGGKVVPKAAPVKKTVVVGGEGSAVPVVKKEI